MCVPLRQLHNTQIQTLRSKEIIPIYKGIYVPLNTNYTSMFNTCPNLYNFSRKHPLQKTRHLLGERSEAGKCTGNRGKCIRLTSLIPLTVNATNFLSTHYRVRLRRNGKSYTLFSGTSRRDKAEFKSNSFSLPPGLASSYKPAGAESILHYIGSHHAPVAEISTILALIM